MSSRASTRQQNSKSWRTSNGGFVTSSPSYQYCGLWLEKATESRRWLTPRSACSLEKVSSRIVGLTRSVAGVWAVGETCFCPSQPGRVWNSGGALLMQEMKWAVWSLLDLIREQCVCRPKKGVLSCWQRAIVIESVQLYIVNKRLLVAWLTLLLLANIKYVFRKAVSTDVIIKGWFPTLGGDAYFVFLSYSPRRFTWVRLCAGSRGEWFPHQNVPVLWGESSKAAAAHLGSLDGVQLPLAAGAHGQRPGDWSSTYPHQEHFCQRQVSVWRGKAQTFLWQCLTGLCFPFGNLWAFGDRIMCVWTVFPCVQCSSSFSRFLCLWRWLGGRLSLQPRELFPFLNMCWVYWLAGSWGCCTYMWWKAFWVWVGEEHRTQYVPFLLKLKSLLGSCSAYTCRCWSVLPVGPCSCLLSLVDVIFACCAWAWSKSVPPMEEGPSRAVCLSMVTLATLCLAGGMTVGRFLITSNHMNWWFCLNWTWNFLISSLVLALLKHAPAQFGKHPYLFANVCG